MDRIGGVDCVLTSCAVDRGFDRWSPQTKDYYIGIVYSPVSTHHSIKE
jgi:hypothetical protein